MLTRISVLAILFTFLSATPLYPQYEYERVLSIPWGERRSEVGIRLESDGNYGPRSFDVSSALLYLLDSENRSVKVFEMGGQLQSAIIVPPFAEDIKVTGNQRIYVLHSGNSVSEFDGLGMLRGVFIIPDEIRCTSGIWTDQSGLTVRMSNGESSTILNGDRLEFRVHKDLISLPGYKSMHDSYYYTQKINRTLGKVSVFDSWSKPISSFNVSSEQNNLASIRFVGSDSVGNSYIDVESFAKEFPLTVNREIRQYSASGHLLNVIRLPRIYYSYMFNDVRVAANGDVYHMLSRENGIEIIRWRNFWRTAGEEVHIAEYPAEYCYELHYNNVHKGESSLDIVWKAGEIASVTRDEALQVADTYVMHAWTCDDVNLTHGTVTAPDGMKICSPEWIAVAQNTKVPYKWGGFQTLAQFDAGLISAKYAGDKFTSKDNGSNYCVGVDCSGFVSRCWKLTTHYSTSMMPQITMAYGSWDQMKKGDAIHKVGHVRMCVQNNPDGTLGVVEASGVDWRVSYRTYTYTQLTGYTPRYYVGMIDVPATVAKDDLPKGFVLEQNYPNPFNPNTRIEYQIARSDRVSLRAFDVLGREVRTLVDENKSAGTHAVDFDATGLPSGVYLYRLMVADGKHEMYISTRKMLLVR
jgi:hypothetical protein